MSSNGPPIQYRVFRLPKRGDSGDCEDAAAVDLQRGRFAIADGTSESSRAGLWAQMLVDEFVQTPAPQPGAWLPAVQLRWSKEVAARPCDIATATWYVETRRLQGAFATFLGLVVEETRWLKRKRWRALAIGDSCVFQVRDGQLRKSFPVARSEDFGNTPDLLGSSSDAQGKELKKKVLGQKGDWCPQDRLWLMTDALAQWFLREHEIDGKPWETLEMILRAPVPETAFIDRIELLRNRQQLRNDDVTLVAVCL
ncbi:MAG: hypothetical protein K2R98_21420 [Gemmataceae bacterium]|nr:hypothetical protein [Gemmataceae bacterium]